MVRATSASITADDEPTCWSGAKAGSPGCMPAAAPPCWALAATQASGPALPTPSTRASAEGLAIADSAAARSRCSLTASRSVSPPPCCNIDWYVGATNDGCSGSAGDAAGTGAVLAAPASSSGLLAGACKEFSSGQ